LEFSLYVAAAMLTLMAVTGYIISNQYVSTVTQNVAEKLLVQARSYSGPAGKHILSAAEPDALMLNNLCRKLSADNPDLYWVGIAGPDSVVIAHTNIRQVVSKKKLPFASNQNPIPGIKTGERLSISGDSVLISVPVVEEGIELGYLSAAGTTRPIKEARRRSITTVASITVIMILLGLPVTMLLVQKKLRPVSTITNQLRKINFDDISINIPISSRNEFGYLAETLHVMGDKLNLARQELVERERMARELEIAREIQVNILPRQYPTSSTFEFGGAYKSAREVGGDYYDFINFGDEHLAFLVADVSGKSLPGMLVMLLTRDIVKNLTRTMWEPGQLLRAVNQELEPNIKKGMFVTMFYGLLYRRTGRFVFASAGHNPLIWVRATGLKPDLVRPKGYPLGMMSPSMFNQRLETAEIQLSPGDCLIQYTDGVNEAHNPKEEEFGMDRLIQAVLTNRTLDPSDMVATVLSHHERFVGSAPQYDDITLVAMKWKGIVDDISSTERQGIIHAY
jgi:serine phosphatase RsbU (regulator of sigma subunit)